MFYKILQYLKFWLRSTNHHGVHSPFVFNLVTHCFYDTSKYSEYNTLKNFRKELLNNNTTLEVTDLGAGSQVMKTQIRKVKRIAKNAGSTAFRTKLLFRLVAYFKPKNILELGTSLGISTYAMHLGNVTSKITTIEGCPNLVNFTKHQLKILQTSNISLKCGDFREVIPSLDTVFDLIFIDGNHQKEATLSYFENLLPKAHNDTIFIFDDIYWSLDMTEAWEAIKKHPKVTVSIDTFFWGFVFLRKEQAKEHFTIRL